MSLSSPTPAQESNSPVRTQKYVKNLQSRYGIHVNSNGWEVLHKKKYSQKEGGRGSRGFQQGLLEEEAFCARLEAVGTRVKSSWESLVKKETDVKTQTRGK